MGRLHHRAGESEGDDVTMRVGRRRPNPKLGIVWYVSLIGFRQTGYLDEFTAQRIARRCNNENPQLRYFKASRKTKRPGAEAPRR
jgi:hypothetical protein